MFHLVSCAGSQERHPVDAATGRRSGDVGYYRDPAQLATSLDDLGELP
jgi:hypothetical protein